MDTWEKILAKCVEDLKAATEHVQACQTAGVGQEVCSTPEGSAYFKGLVEIYGVGARISSVSAQDAATTDAIQVHAWQLKSAWAAISEQLASFGLKSFIDATISSGVQIGPKCSVCTQNIGTDKASINMLGRDYHAPCANYWQNRVDKNAVLPSLS